MKRLRLLAPAVITLALSGCGVQGSLWSDYYQIVRGSFGNNNVTLEQAAAIPYASLAYRVEGGNEMMLVLATDTKGDQLWTAATRVVMVTRDGRILRTVGLPRNKSQTTTQGSETLPPPALALKGAFRSTRLSDFADAGLYSVALSCVATPRGRQIVTILGTAIATTRIDETCTSRDPRWSFTDSYWVDEAGFAWQSVQNIGPAGPKVQVRILRPPE